MHPQNRLIHVIWPWKVLFFSYIFNETMHKKKIRRRSRIMRWSTNAIFKSKHTHTDTTRVRWQQSDYTMLSNRLFLLSLLSCDSCNCCRHVVLMLRTKGKFENFFMLFSYVHDFSTRKPGIIAKCIMCLKFFLCSSCFNVNVCEYFFLYFNCSTILLHLPYEKLP